MDAALLLKNTGPLNRYTYHYMIGLLATTGLRLSEALGLKLTDITPDGLVVRQSKLGKSRLVPLHDSASKALSEYLEIRMREADATNTCSFSPTANPLITALSRRSSSDSRRIVADDPQGWHLVHAMAGAIATTDHRPSRAQFERNS